MRGHDEVVEFVVRWLFDGGLDEIELDVIARADVLPEPGLCSVRHLTPDVLECRRLSSFVWETGPEDGLG